MPRLTLVDTLLRRWESQPAVHMDLLQLVKLLGEKDAELDRWRAKARLAEQHVRDLRRLARGRASTRAR